MSDIWDFSPSGIAFPLWLGILLLLAFALIASNFWWIYKYLVMRPVAGHGTASKSGSDHVQQVLVFGMNRAFSIQILDYMEKVLSFKDPNRVARWLQTSPFATGMLGKKSIMLISEIFDTCKDPVAELAIVTVCREHNKTVTDMSDMIITYNDFKAKRELLEHNNPVAVNVPSVMHYNPADIYQYTPENRTAGQFGGTVLKDAGDLNRASAKKTFWEKNIQLFVCVIFAVAMIIISAWFALNWNPHPAAAAAQAASAVPIPGVTVVV